MKKYIIDDRIVTGPVEGWPIGYERRVLLTPEQTDFHLANPTASIREVLREELDPLPPQFLTDPVI